MKQEGKKTKEWKRTRREYLKANPANFEGYHQCSICGRWVDQVDLDHIKKRGSHPELIHDHSNLRKICRFCHIKVT